MKWKPMWTDFLLMGLGAAGLALFFHHIAYYDIAWHWGTWWTLFANHGLYGFIMLVVSIAALIWKHPPRKGKR